MSNNLSRYNDILFMGLRPWIFGEKSEAQIIRFTSDLKKEYFENSPKYILAFIKPLSPFRKYYHRLIDIEAIKYLNDFHRSVSDAGNNYEREYILNKATSKLLPEKLRETASVIRKRNYSFQQIDIQPGQEIGNRQRSNESYVLHLLKFQLVRILMEIRDTYASELDTESLSIDEIFFNYFNEVPPKKLFIYSNKQEPGYEDSSASTSQSKFIVIKNDIRVLPKGVYSYLQIVKDPSRFARLEDQFFLQGLIDKDYRLIDKHGNKQLLAAIYHRLIEKKYFNSIILPKRRQVKDIDIRRFLDNRYQTDVSQQLTKLRNDPELLISIFSSNEYWGCI